MVTKSKSDWTFLLSIIALIVAAFSIGYCCTYFFAVFEDGEMKSQLLTQIMKLFNGGV